MARRARKQSGTRRKAPAKRSQGKPVKRWSHRVMQTSDALDLQPGIFTKADPHQIALALKRSAEASRRRKAEPFRSAMSMLNFEINRAGKNLTPQRRRVLNQAKQELRRVFHRPPASG